MADDQQYQDEGRSTAKTLWLGDVQVSCVVVPQLPVSFRKKHEGSKLVDVCMSPGALVSFKRRDWHLGGTRSVKLPSLGLVAQCGVLVSAFQKRIGIFATRHPLGCWSVVSTDNDKICSLCAAALMLCRFAAFTNPMPTMRAHRPLTVAAGLDRGIRGEFV